MIRLTLEEITRHRKEGKKTSTSNARRNFHELTTRHAPCGASTLLDTGEDKHPDDDSKAVICRNALHGTCMGETMRLAISVRDQTLTSLVDSDSTDCFMVAQVTCRLNLTPTAKDGMTVGVANDERLPCLGVCSKLSFSINGESFCIDFLINALEGYKVVLECNWLRDLEPIVWDFSHLSMAFWWLDHRVKWTGLGTHHP
jgi:hypothetical protein